MLSIDKLWQDIEKIRNTSPLVHNITNYVVMNTTANALLAIGASPVMAHAVEEVESMTGIANSLVINIGTLSKKWIEAMSLAMKTAKTKRIPIVFDPVGAGATSYRTETCLKLMNETHPNIIRGNASEIMALVDSKIKTKGVDSAHTSDTALKAAENLAEAYGCTVIVSGKVDLITDETDTIYVKNGHEMLSKVTGSGCTATAIVGAFIAVNESSLFAGAHAMAVMGICGEIAAKNAKGPGSLQLNLLDAFYNLTKSQIEDYLK
ncbi:MAG: hydroxyethylthiazole kinase [Candidatus Cloacimonetes bacterium]|nr:hydroxyethylthiazole kinase [Candidatus Cloacimonadota bacterium]